MLRFSASEVQEALSLTIKDSNVVFSDITTDTRKIKEGALFVALKGEKFNGEDFVAEAVEKGATGVVVSTECDEEKISGLSAEVFVVKDTLKAYQALASYHRDRFNIPIIAITGSNGKTTTKDLTAAAISGKLNVLKTQANFNNEIGLPYTLLGLTNEHDVAVVECGMRGLHQIEELAEIARPSIGIVTNVGETHIEILGSIENIALAKSELVSAIPEGGTVILNADNPYVFAMKDKVHKGVKVITFGMGKEADVQGMNFQQTDDYSTIFDCRIGGKLTMFRLPMVGKHNLYNALSAIAAATVLGVLPVDIQLGFTKMQATKMRFEMMKKNNYTIINDAYNASPMSMEAAVTTLKDVAKGRRILVLGDMLELGEIAEDAHAQIGRIVAQSKAEMLITYGNLAQKIGETAREEGMKDVYATKTHEESAKILKEIVKEGDTVLFKGSRGMQMEKIIELL